MTTGMDLKLTRVKARLTQKQIAEAAGLSRSWVAKVENPADPDEPVSENDVARYDAALRTFGVVRHSAG